MPPPVELSEAESESGGESIPFEGPAGRKKKEVTKNGDVSAASDQDEDDDEEEGDEPDVYVVEKIVGHEWKGNKLLLLVKWKGYEDPKDMTLEPESNLETAKEAVKEYFEKIGGRPERTLKRRKSGNVAASGPSSSKKQRLKSTATTIPEPPSDAQEADWFPKGTKSWDDEVIRVDTIVRDEKTNTLNAMVTWNNRKRGKVSLRLAYERLPQKMLQFYESHLVFKE